jgi:acetylornithine deacetylase/succinyl-diaminopimelate desuccinylase-like protein
VADPRDDVTAESVDLLAHLLRNACVNDGRVGSGGEARSVDVLEQYLGGVGLDFEHYEPQPGRTSLLARIEGWDPDAPSLMLMGHTDVVPVNVDGWSRDPFGAEIVDGFVWGRGAVDMLNLTATQAVAFRRLAASGFRPRGTLLFLAVADEEARGVWGADWLLEHELGSIYADYVLTESGGYQVATPEGVRLPVLAAEKGTFWSTLRFRGTPGHGSAPYRTDNALVTAARAVQRLADYAPSARIHDVWRGYVERMGFAPELREALLDPQRFAGALDELPLGMARLAHACTHTTFAPTIVHGGTKINVIPDEVELSVDVRTLPGQTAEEVREEFREALGDLADRVEIDSIDDPSSVSPIETPLWDSLARVSARLVEGSALVPFLQTGATDNRFFRRAGAVGYGFGLFSRRLTQEDYMTMFHGNDERVDVESLTLSAQLWEAVARDFQS